MADSTLLTFDDNWSVMGDLDDRSWIGLAYQDEPIDFVTELFSDEDDSTSIAHHLALFLDAEVIETDDLYGILVGFPTADDPETYKLAYVQPKDEEPRDVYISAGEDLDEIREAANSYVHKED